MGKRILAAVIVLSLLGLAPAAGQTRQDIDPIRAKIGALGPGDEKIIMSFVGVQLNKIATAVNVNDLNDYYEAFVEARYSSAPPDSPAWLAYREAFAQGIKQNWQKAMTAATAGTDAALAQKARTAIAIIIAQYDHPLLIDDVLILLKDSLPQVRYGAAKGFTVMNIRKHLDETSEALAAVQAGLSGAMETETNSEVIAQMAQAGGFPNEQGINLLIKALQTQRKAYQQWSLTCNENADAMTLQQAIQLAMSPALSQGTGSSGDQQNPLANKRGELLYAIAELYAAGLQRYVKGALYVTEDGTPLSLLPQRNELQLQSLLIDIERELRRISSSQRPPRMAAALQKTTPQMIRAEMEATFEDILGYEGELQRALTIYKTEDAYKALPLLVPDPSVKLVNRARALQNLIIHEEKKRETATTLPGMPTTPRQPRR